MLIHGDNKQTQAPSSSSKMAGTGATAQGEHLPAPGFTDLVARNTRNVTLSREGNEYIKKLTAYVESCKTHKITLSDLPAPTNGIVFRNDRYGFILLFAETMPDPKDGLPKSALIESAVNTAVRWLGSDIKIINTVIVTHDDYEYADIMWHHILTILDTVTNPAIMNTKFEELVRCKYRVDTNLHEVNKMIRTYTPHAILDRTDYGFVLEVEYNGEWQPMAAVTGYTEFHQSGGGAYSNTPKFHPTIHISNIVSVIPTPSLLAILMPLAMDMFIYQSLWRQPFMSFSKDRPNLGSLYLDPQTQQTSFLSKPLELDQFVNHMCGAPVLVLDVVDGRARMPGLEAFAEPGLNDFIFGEMNHFLETQLTPQRMVVDYVREFTGTVIVGGEMKDTREIDYFQVHKNMDYATASYFLSRSKDPMARLEMIRQIHGSVNSLYCNQICVLNGQVLLELGALTGRRFQFLSDYSSNQNTFNVGLLEEQGNIYKHNYTGSQVFTRVIPNKFGNSKYGSTYGRF